MPTGCLRFYILKSTKSRNWFFKSSTEQWVIRNNVCRLLGNPLLDGFIWSCIQKVVRQNSEKDPTQILIDAVEHELIVSICKGTLVDLTKLVVFWICLIKQLQSAPSGKGVTAAVNSSCKSMTCSSGKGPGAPVAADWWNRVRVPRKGVMMLHLSTQIARKIPPHISESW